jgi:hypothetical protein
VKAGVRELSFRFDTGDGQLSIGAAAGLGDKGIQEGSLPDSCLAGKEQRRTVFRSCCQGSIELTQFDVTPDQLVNHATTIA